MVENNRAKPADMSGHHKVITNAGSNMFRSNWFDVDLIVRFIVKRVKDSLPLT